LKTLDEVIRRFVRRSNRIFSSPERDRLVERQLLLQCLMAAKMNRNLARINALADVEFSGFSQWGEDGIIDWLVEKLPQIPRTFVEFGVENYSESNTRLLLKLRNWRGLVLDGSNEHIASIMRESIYWQYNLTAKCAFIDCENVNNLIDLGGMSGEIGLLSIDIDGNDYWVWQSISVVKPIIIVTEYNAVLGDLRRLAVPYQANFRRTIAHHSNLYFGASLAALIELGYRKGYTFIGTNTNGCNAFFVRNEFVHGLLQSIDKVLSFPSVFRESRNEINQLTFTSGTSRLKEISHLPVYDFETNTLRPLSELGELYSEKWK